MVLLVILGLAAIVGLLYWLRHAAQVQSVFNAHRKGYYTYTVHK